MTDEENIEGKSIDPSSHSFLPASRWGKVILSIMGLILVVEITWLVNDFDVIELFDGLKIASGAFAGIFLVAFMIALISGLDNWFFSTKLGVAISDQTRKVMVTVKEIGSFAVDSTATIIGWIFAAAGIAGFCYFLFSIPAWAAVIIVLLVLILAKLG